MALEDQTKRVKLLKCEKDEFELNEDMHFGKTSFTMPYSSFFLSPPLEPTYAQGLLKDIIEAQILELGRISQKSSQKIQKGESHLSPFYDILSVIRWGGHHLESEAAQFHQESKDSHSRWFPSARWRILRRASVYRSHQ